MAGILYGVGVGPGDPELITRKAARVIEECKIIAIPESGGGRNISREIAADLIGGKEILICDMPMTRDRLVLEQSHRKVAEQITQKLVQGDDVAFLTLGDPTVYSTYIYVHKLVAAMGFEARIVPGVPSFCAAAAALGDSLCEGKQMLHIIPASYPDWADALDLPGAKVLMKSGTGLRAAFDELNRRDLLERSSLVQNCTMPDERIVSPVEIFDVDPSYFSLVIVKE